jgi:hypothetical protein
MQEARKHKVTKAVPFSFHKVKFWSQWREGYKNLSSSRSSVSQNICKYKLCYVSLSQQTLLFEHFYLKYTKACFTGGSKDRQHRKGTGTNHYFPNSFPQPSSMSYTLSFTELYLHNHIVAS